MSNKLLAPDGWLVLGLPWPEQTQDGWGECAVAVAPAMIPRHLVSKGADIALDLATGLARDPNDGPGKAVFFSDVTLWLDKQGKDWADFGADYEAVIDELVKAPVPQLYMTLVQKAHAILCDASRGGCACTTRAATSNTSPRRYALTFTPPSPPAWSGTGLPMSRASSTAAPSRPGSHTATGSCDWAS
ncbi:hypothetical protein ACFRQM_46325 [Streptomyces sp. NPDC056831]|uniref:hypothetical protein n=1 Tax=Streptomyces sp. NPDC056831 TaxID=3345954 RepID=UPI0036C12CF1